MSSSSKILTVSYGTFSCTAEGFDDPLEAVKETTHFFRGVVGEDRFFGAEPPQFDPELASEYLRDRLADSGKAGGTLSLGSPPRVMAAAASAGAMAAAFNAGPADAEETDSRLPDDDTIEATAVLTEKSVPDDAEVSLEADLSDLAFDGTEAAPAPHASAPDDISAKLDRIRAVVAQTEEEEASAEPDLVEPAAEVAEPAPEPAAELDPEPFISDTMPPDLEAAEPEPEEEDLVAPELEFSEPELSEPEPEANPDALESLLGELVVESGDADAAELTSDSLEDDTDLDTDDGALDAAVASLMAGEDDKTEDDETAEHGSAMPVAAATAAVAALVGGAAMASQEDASDDDAYEDDVAEDLTSEDDAWDEDDRDTADFEDIDAAETALDNAWAAKAGAHPSLEDFEEDEADLPEAEADEPEAAHFAPMPQQAPGVAPVRARVVKVKRAALEQAIDEGTLEEIVDDPTPTSAPVPVSESSLTPEEEEELARELAAVKAELASDFGAWDEDEVETEEERAESDAPERTALRFDDDEDEDLDDAAILESAAAESGADTMGPLRLEHPVQTPEQDWTAEDDQDEADDLPEDKTNAAVQDTARKAVKMASPARALLTEQEVADDDTSRILDQTNTELDEPEGNRRRSAIAHLRAAVAATKADRLLGRKTDAAEEQEPYREDLASVVRPRRPQSTGIRQTRPESTPSAGSPLKLVADQLVRAAEAPQPEASPADAASASPVRPRRVRRAAPSAEHTPHDQDGEDSDFANYAHSVGATDLPELLEAAAAYMSYVEGRDQFSRPQLMTTLRQAEATDSSREDRLRSFGQLLREGKIRKTSGGRFTAAETISFKPDRAANG